jgi:hypothetical protein
MLDSLFSKFIQIQKAKEIVCLYKIKTLALVNDISIEQYLGKVVTVIASAWTFTHFAQARIKCCSYETTTKNFTESILSMRTDLLKGQEIMGFLEITYPQEILNQAEYSLAEGNQESAETYLNVAINGCKYMIESQVSSEEYHKSGVISLVLDHDFLKDIINNKNTLLIIVIILVVILIIVTILIKKLRLKKKKFTQDIVDANKEKNNPGASDSTESENISKQPIGGYDRV